MSIPTSASAAEKEADAIRAALGDTLDRLKGNLRPSSLAKEAVATTRAATPPWLVRSWDLARSPSGFALVGAALASVAGTLVAGRRRRIRR